MAKKEYKYEDYDDIDADELDRMIEDTTTCDDED